MEEPKLDSQFPTDAASSQPSGKEHTRNLGESGILLTGQVRSGTLPKSTAPHKDILAPAPALFMYGWEGGEKPLLTPPPPVSSPSQPGFVHSDQSPPNPVRGVRTEADEPLQVLLQTGRNHRIMASLRLEKACKVVKSNC